MATQIKGANNKSVVSESRRKQLRRDASPEFHGNVPVGDEHNVRGFATEGNRVGGHIRGTRPDRADGMMRAA